MFLNEKNSVESKIESVQSESPALNPIFDNPLKRFVLSIKQVADAFYKSEITIIRMVNRGVLKCHYAGDTMFFLLDEVIEDFKSDKLAHRRKRDADNTETRSSNRTEMVRSKAKDARKNLEQELQGLSASFGLDQ